MNRILITAFLIASVCFAYAQIDEDASSDERLAAQYMREGDFESAVVLYEELFASNPGPVIYNNYLQCLLELQEFRKAERVVREQIRINPSSARFQVDLGYVQDKAGDARRVRRHFDGLIKDLPPNPNAVTDLANAFLFREYEDLALQTYLRGRSMLGASHPFNLPLAQLYSRMGENEKMMTEYVDLLLIDESYMENVQGLLQDHLNNDPVFAKSDALRRILLQRSQQNPQISLFSEMLLWLSLQQKDFPMALRQARVLDRRMEQEGKLVIEVARLAVSNNAYAVARQGYEFVLENGNLNPYFLEAKVGLLDVKYLQATTGYEIDNDLLKEVEREYLKTIDEMGVRAQTVVLVRNLAHLQAFYLNKTEEATLMLQAVIDVPNVPNRVKAECRIEMADILLLRGDLWDAHLLYAQVDKSFRDDPLAHEARFKNARLSFYMGEFKWAKAQLDVLKAATSRLIANDAMALSLLIQDNLAEDGSSVPLQMFARAEMHTFMNNFHKALATLDSVKEKFPSHQIMDNVMMASAHIFIKTGRYEQADELLAAITEQYPKGLLAADALFERAQLHQKVLQNNEKAMELYQQLITQYPGSLYTVSARNEFRYLRGDTRRDEGVYVN